MKATSIQKILPIAETHTQEKGEKREAVMTERESFPFLNNNVLKIMEIEREKFKQEKKKPITSYKLEA